MSAIRRFTISLIAVIAVLIVFIFLNTGIFADYRHNRTDKKLWMELSNTFEEEKVSRVELVSNISVELTGEKKDDFIKGLSKAKFYRSNWRKEGPTGPVITIVFKDDSMHYFQYWGGDVFETMYKNGQFLISSHELSEILRKYNISL